MGMESHGGLRKLKLADAPMLRRPFAHPGAPAQQPRRSTYAEQSSGFLVAKIAMGGALCQCPCADQRQSRKAGGDFINLTQDEGVFVHAVPME